MRFYSSAQTLEIQLDLVALAKDKNKDRSRRIYVLGGGNLLMEESSRIICGLFADTDFFALYVRLDKEDEDLLLRSKH